MGDLPGAAFIRVGARGLCPEPSAMIALDYRGTDERDSPGPRLRAHGSRAVGVRAGAPPLPKPVRALPPFVAGWRADALDGEVAGRLPRRSRGSGRRPFPLRRWARVRRPVPG